MSQLQTNWIRIATAGNAIDGRVIDEKVIREMAETYSPDEYQARIWPEHRRWFGAWGDVIALKAEEWQGKWRLFAKLRPNSLLMQANESDQKTFCSIEIFVKDFDGTGKHYLQGLGVTDEPGSLGTEKLTFNKDKGSIYSEPEVFLIEEVQDTENQSTFRKVMNLFGTSHKDKSTTQITTEDTNVEKAQFDQIMSGINGISTKQEELENRFSALEQKQNDGGSEVEIEPEVKTEGVTAEQFSTALTEALKPMTEKLDGLETKFNKLADEVPGQEPEGTGAPETTVEAL